MRFIGNKESLVYFIENAIKQTNANGKVFFDAFSGTTKVAQHFKKQGVLILDF